MRPTFKANTFSLNFKHSKLFDLNGYSIPASMFVHREQTLCVCLQTFSELKANTKLFESLCERLPLFAILNPPQVLL